MLEKLDNIDWSRLRNGHGRATDIPARLRELASDNADKRKNALFALTDHLFHQESNLYEATAYAVPFLLELLDSDGVPDKLKILTFIAGIGKRLRMGNPRKAKRLDETRKDPPWVRQLEDAIADGEPVYLRFLHDDDPKTRDTAGYVLALLKRASLKDPAPETADAIWNRLKEERDERVQTGMLLAFGSLCEANEFNCGLLLAKLIQTNSKSVKLATALPLMRLMPEETAQEALAAVLDAVKSPDGYDALVGSIWCGSLWGVHLLAIKHLLFLAPKPASVVEEALTRQLPTQPLERALDIARVLLAMAFREPVSREATFSSLTEPQQRIVKLIAANDNCWIRNKEENIETVGLPFLGRYGLPDTAAALRSFVKGRNSG